MREIKFIGNLKRGNDSRNYRYSLFECPVCNEHVVKKTRDGLNAKRCSHQCYAKTRIARGAYKDHVMISGYKYLRSTSHPLSTKSGYVAEHRLIMEEFIGRPIPTHLDIHHINLNKTDNRINNLIILNKRQHAQAHSKGVLLNGK